MEFMTLILLLLACVVVSSALDQMLSRISLPLIQIAVGLLVAIVFPNLADVHVDSEVFMMLFIAPLLFREAKETNIPQLKANIGSVLSMAIALVIATVLIAGYALHFIIPSIPLAAAFACAAALGPTDAAAVQALGSTIHLTKRQSTLLSGESLINDASGVVSFEFAIAAAVTGAFSLAEAVGSFAILFFGGLGMGILLGVVLRLCMLFLKKKGYVNTTMHVVYEVLSPFLIFLIAEECHVSGVLAVVAAGLLMQEHHGNIVSPETAEREMVSNSFWEVIIFVINGVIFVMLGMQLPKVMNPDAMGGIRPVLVFCAMFAVTAMVLLVRFIWLAVMGLSYYDPEYGERGTANLPRSLREALVTTISGPKGAVTLSIILTIPLTVAGGDAFPQRDLIIFLTSGAILCTLVLADFVLPRLAPKPVDVCGDIMLDRARIAVLDGVIRQMRAWLEENPDAEFAPAGRLALMRYRRRLMHLRMSMGQKGAQLQELADQVLEVQQKRADQIQQAAYDLPETERMPYYSMLPEIRESLGYFGGSEHVGARFETKKGRTLLKLRRLWKSTRDYDDEKTARIYYDTCLFAIDLEQTAVAYLEDILEKEGYVEPKERQANPDLSIYKEGAEIAGGNSERAEIAALLLEEHKASLLSLWGRINYRQDQPMDISKELRHSMDESLPEGMKNKAGDQFAKARKHNDEVDAIVLEMELGQVRKLRLAGQITEQEARTLREEVYLLQTSFLEAGE